MSLFSSSSEKWVFETGIKWTDHLAMGETWPVAQATVFLNYHRFRTVDRSFIIPFYDIENIINWTYNNIINSDSQLVGG